MMLVIKEWPVSCEVNFTKRGNNKQAWLGHAACCLDVGSPEEPTRAAWWTLPSEIREAGDAAAAEVIAIWEERYRCQDIA